jgi:hypothetical protein
MKKLIYILFVSMILPFGSHSNSIQNTNENFFSREQYRKASEGFHYKKPLPLKPLEENKYKEPDLEWLKYISYAIVLSVIIFLIYKLIIYIYSPDNRKLKNTEIPLQQIEEEPTIESDLENLLEKALKENNFREAIRIYYLFSIRNLNEKHILNYTIDKTNYEYLSEVGGHAVFPLFRELTMTFEKTWFGDAPADELKLNAYRLKYSNLNEIISSNRNKPNSA